MNNTTTARKTTLGTARLLAGAVATAVALSLSVSTLTAQQVVGPRAGVARPGVMVAPIAVNQADPQNPGTRPASDDADNPIQVYIEDSFAAAEKLNRAMSFERKDQVPQAIEAYQNLIDEYGDKLTKLDNNTYISLMDAARHRLELMPAVKSGAYDDLFSVPAEAAIKTAIAHKDLAALTKACDRYYIATAAVKGMQTAAEWEFERGEFAMAARLWSQLADHPRAGTGVAEYLHHAALAAHLDGNDDQAKKLRERLAGSFPNATAEINGKTVNLTDNVDELLKSKPWETAVLPTGEWPTFQGNAARSAVPDVSSTAGAKLWSVALDDPKGTNPGRPRPAIMNRLPNGTIDTGSGAQLSSFAVMSQDMLFVHTGDRILAMSAASGGLRWGYPATGGVRKSDLYNQQIQMYGQVMRSASHDSCTVFGDQVFGILPASASAGGRRANPNIYYNGITQNTELVALDKNGQELFKPVLSNDLDIAKQGSVSFVGSPTVTQHGVFLLARRTGNDTFTNLYLCRINRATGVVDWTRYLCGAPGGNMYGGIQAQFQGAAAPSFADDTVYINTGQGVDAAIDAATGRVRWLALTDSARQVKGMTAYEQQQMMTAVPSAWKFNAPIVIEDKLVTLEPGSAFRVYDRWTGKPVLNIPVKNLGNPDILAGIVDGKAILVGRDIHFIALKNGADVAWPSPMPPVNDAGRLQGRPFLAKKVLYLPMEKALAMIDLEKAFAADDDSTVPAAQLTYWPKDEKNVVAKPGNLLVTSEQVIVINDTEIASYSKWETARDSRLAAIKANPTAPEGYLSLAEVAFRTAHFDIAQENMVKAVQFAVAKGMDADITGEIYRVNLLLAEQLAAKTDDQRNMARFYYEQAKNSAGNAEANAEWRLSLSNLSLTEKKPEEAASLYSQILLDPAMRSATLHKGESTARAGTVAETSFKALLESQGAENPELYKSYEQQAGTMLASIRAAQDPAAYQNLIDSYPNSRSAVTASGELAAIYGKKGSFEEQIHTLWWQFSHTTVPAEKARITVDQAIANASLKRWDSAQSWISRGRRLAPDLTWTAAGKTMNFADLRADLHAMMPNMPETRRPVFSSSMNDALMKLTQGNALPLGDANTTSNAKLLVPMETSQSARRPDVIPVMEDRTVRLYEAATLKQRWEYAVPGGASTVLLGYTSDAMILLQSAKAIALDLKTGEMKYSIDLTMKADEIQRHQMEVSQLQQFIIQQLQQNPVNGLQQINWQMYQQYGGDGEFLVNPQQNGMYGGGQVTIDADQIHAAAFRSMLVNPNTGLQPSFNAIRIFGSKIAVITGNRLNAYDASSGKHLWDTVTLPAGCAQTLMGNDDVIVAEVEKIDVNNPLLPDNGTATMVVIDAATGKSHATIQVPEHVMWRNVGDDGMLTCVTEEGVSAYDLMGDSTQPRWRNDKVRAISPQAIAMSLDGVALVNRNNELECLKVEDGQDSFTPRRIDAAIANPNTGMMTMRLIPDGETVIVQGSQSIGAYRTSDGNTAWKAVFSEAPPPIVAAQLTENHIAILGNGPIANVERGVKILVFNRVDPHTGELSNGKNELEKPLRRSATDPVGPIIQRWMVVDNAICLEISGSVFIYRSKAEAK